MGHVISKDGLKPEPDYLSKVLPKLSEITQPLRNLTTKEAKFIWAPQHDEAFKQVNALVTKHPVLRFYDVTKSVSIQYDASKFGLGATLLQEGQPITFASRTLSKTERHYSQIEKECLSIVFASLSLLQENKSLPWKQIINHLSLYSRNPFRQHHPDFNACFRDYSVMT